MVPGGIPRFLGSTAAAVAERHALPVEVQGFALPVWREVSDTPRQNKSSQWLTSCARQPISKIKSDFRRRPAVHKPARRKSTTPLHGCASIPQNASPLPSHAELCDQDHIRIPWRFDDECAALRQPEDCLSFSFPQSKIFKEGLRRLFTHPPAGMRLIGGDFRIVGLSSCKITYKT